MMLETNVMFRHYVITRFNIVQGWLSSPDKNNNPTLTSEWLERRFELFERYTLPSFMNQSNNNFVWLVLFDDKISEYYISSYIKKYTKMCNFFMPLYMEAYDDENKFVLDYIRKEGRKEGVYHNYQS